MSPIRPPDTSDKFTRRCEVVRRQVEMLLEAYEDGVLGGGSYQFAILQIAEKTSRALGLDLFAGSEPDGWSLLHFQAVGQPEWTASFQLHFERFLIYPLDLPSHYRPYPAAEAKPAPEPG